MGSHCLECAKASRPAASDRVRLWNASQPALVTMSLMAINIAIFLWMSIADTDNLSGRTTTTQQIDLGLFKPALEFRDEWYRLVTSGFLHFGIIHIAFNMFLLYQLGNMLEPAIGRVRFGLLYFAALLGGSAGGLIIGPDHALQGGASGAVFGLMTAAFIGLRQRGINPFSTGIGSLLVLNIIITFTIPDISIGGHVGGIVAGGLAGWVVMSPTSRLPQWTTYAAPTAIAVLAVVVSVAVARM